VAYVDLRRRREEHSRRKPEASRRRFAPDPLFLLASGFAAGCLASFFFAVFLEGALGYIGPAPFLLLAVLSLLLLLFCAGRRLAGRGSGTAAPKAGSEKQLLLAIQGAGDGVTPVEAALETSLTVDEAEEALTSLADRGHLVVRSRDGALVYALPGGHPPETL